MNEFLKIYQQQADNQQLNMIQTNSEMKSLNKPKNLKNELQ